MFIRLLVIVSLILGNCLITIKDVKAQEGNLSQPIPGQFIVKFKDSNESSNEKANKLEKNHGAMIEHVFENSFKGATVKLSPGKEKDLKNDPDIEQIVQDFTVYANDKPNDFNSNSKLTAQGMTTTPSQVIPTGVNYIDAELNTTNEGNGVTIAVLDTGIYFSHPDLMVNIPLSRDFSGDNTGGNDNNFGTAKGHGTHVAGVIAALNNTTGVLGVGSQINLVSVKVLNGTGSGSFGSIIAGLDYVTSNAMTISVANLSLGANGGTNPSQSYLDVAALLQQAVQRAVNAGVIVVVAAGNESVNVTSNYCVPAMYPEVITVSALDDRDGKVGGDQWAYFSNYGLEVDIIAPGVNILSTSNDGKTSSLSGTSFSSPHVAGTVGLYIARNGRPSNGDARLLSSLLSAISQSRSLLSGEPQDGNIEPSCYANGPGLQ